MEPTLHFSQQLLQRAGIMNIVEFTMLSSSYAALGSPWTGEGKSAAQSTKRVESIELCKLFGITSSTIFDGEVIKKKYCTDYRFKDSFVWVNLATKSMHWAKTESRKNQPELSKYLLFKKSKLMNEALKEERTKIGEMKGVVKTIGKMPGEKGLVIVTEDDEFLELKVSTEAVKNWIQVVKILG
mmetsp:Transcript_14272/g.21307  ORF Transcript_14272/g.21307 Transcript_14272/m.21307 type:complete len:184 (+) Transcript_14272:295-846(+)